MILPVTAVHLFPHAAGRGCDDPIRVGGLLTEGTNKCTHAIGCFSQNASPRLVTPGQWMKLLCSPFYGNQSDQNLDIRRDMCKRAVVLVIAPVAGCDGHQ